MKKALFVTLCISMSIFFGGCFVNSHLSTGRPPLHYQSKFNFFQLPADEEIIKTTYTSFITEKENGVYVLREFYGDVLVTEAFYSDKKLQTKNGSYKAFDLYNGKLRSETNYVNNEIEGKETQYFESGKIKRETQYAKGLKSGETYGYFESGAIETAYFFKDDKEIEPRIYYYENGVKKMTININPKNYETENNDFSNYYTVYYGSFELFDSLANKICEGEYVDGELENTNCNKETISDEMLDPAVEEMPVFPGGDNELLKFLYGRIKYQAIAKNNSVQGLVVLSFVVLEDGSINDVKILRGIDPSIAEEAVRVVQLMPNWSPGKVQGKPVKVSYKLPVRFKLE